MKKLIFFLTSTILIISSIISPSFAISFSDLETSHWAYNNIMLLAEQGVINGYENGTYKPEKSVTRGEFLKLIMVSLYGGNEYFKVFDFSTIHWALSYAMEASNEGYMMSGASVNNLDDAITRKEMIHILAKICTSNGIRKDIESEAISFLDVSDLDEETKIYINFVTQNGLINGYTDGKIKVDKTMTRAEVATVLTRFIDLRA